MQGPPPGGYPPGYRPPQPSYGQVPSDAYGQPLVQQQQYPMQHQPQGQYPMQPHYPQHPQAQYQQPYPMQQPPVQVFVQQNQHAATYVVKAPFSHGLHIVLDIFTCGAWIPIHLICWAIH
jgi:hypothetical protein